MWSPNSHFFPNVSPGTVVQCEFNYSGNKVIKNVSAGCGCTTAIQNGKRINASLKTSIPDYLDTMQMSKTITVKYEDDTTDVLTINANVVR